jgi:RNA polymerase sigma-70 factor (ECF subfamily)
MRVSPAPQPAPANTPAVVPSAPLSATDEELLSAIRGGDGNALGQLYDRYGRIAFAVAYRVLEERGAAEDAVQDAFLAVWQRAATFQADRGSVRAWLLTITRNAAVDRRRGRHAWTMTDTPLDDVAFRLTTEAEDTFVAAAAMVDAERVRRALDALPPEQRRVIELAYDGGLTHHEIAARTGVPLGTVKGRMRLGLQRLRQLLGEPPAPPQPSARAGETKRDDQPDRAAPMVPRRQSKLRFGMGWLLVAAVA